MEWLLEGKFGRLSVSGAVARLVIDVLADSHSARFSELLFVRRLVFSLVLFTYGRKEEKKKKKKKR